MESVTKSTNPNSFLCPSSYTLRIVFPRLFIALLVFAVCGSLAYRDEDDFYKWSPKIFGSAGNPRAAGGSYVDMMTSSSSGGSLGRNSPYVPVSTQLYPT